MRTCVACERSGPGVVVPGSDKCVGCMDPQDVEQVRWDLLGDELIAVVAAMRAGMARQAGVEKQRWDAWLRAESRRGCEI